MKPEKVDHHLKEKIKDPYFRKLQEIKEQKLQIVKRIIDYRIKNKISQSELAKLADVSQQHISKIENGEFSSIATLEKVLIHIGYTVRIQAIPLKKGLQAA